MKKQILSLIACSTFFASSPVFAMDPDPNRTPRRAPKRAAERTAKQQAYNKEKAELNDADFAAALQKNRLLGFEYYNLCESSHPLVSNTTPLLDTIFVDLIDESGQWLSGTISPLVTIHEDFDEMRAGECDFIHGDKVKLSEYILCERSQYSSRPTPKGYQITCTSDAKIGVRVTFPDYVDFFYSAKRVAYDFNDLLVPGRKPLKQSVMIPFMRVSNDETRHALVDNFRLCAYVVHDYTIEKVKVQLGARRHFVPAAQTGGDGTGHGQSRGTTYSFPPETKLMDLQGQKIVFLLEFDEERIQ